APCVKSNANHRQEIDSERNQFSSIHICICPIPSSVVTGRLIHSVHPIFMNQITSSYQFFSPSYHLASVFYRAEQHHIFPFSGSNILSDWLFTVCFCLRIM